MVVFVSAEDAAHDWTRVKHRAALNRAVRERREYVLPARFDDTPLPGLLSDLVTIYVRTNPAAAVRRYARRQAGRLGHYVASAAGRCGSASVTEAARRYGRRCRWRTGGRTGRQSRG